MLTKAATKEDKSTFTSSFSKKTAPGRKVTLKGFEILRRNWRLRVFRDTCHQIIDSKIAVLVIWRLLFRDLLAKSAIGFHSTVYLSRGCAVYNALRRFPVPRTFACMRRGSPLSHSRAKGQSDSAKRSLVRKRQESVCAPPYMSLLTGRLRALWYTVRKW